MSDTGSSRKSPTETGDTDSTEGPLIFDRWTNNITYRQLVLSTCVGIFQLWWHPYITDFRKLLPFLFLYNLFSMIIAYPVFYLELALGVITRKGVVNCWDLAPVARGLGFTMLWTCIFSAFAAGIAGAWSLALCVHSLHTFLPWLHCAAAAAWPCAARHRPLPAGSDTPPQSFFFNFVLDLKREGLAGGLGNVAWEVATYYMVCWLIIYLIIIKKIYSYSKLVLFKDVLTFFVLVCCAVGVSQLKGARRMFDDCDWSVLLEGSKIWCDALEFSLVELAVSQGTLTMLGSYFPKEQRKLGTTAILTLLVSKAGCMLSAFILGGTHGALYNDYDNVTNIWTGSSATIILWSDFAARVPGSQFWSLLIFFMLFLLSVTTAALLVQTIMSSLTGRSIRRISWAFLILTCVLFCLIGVMTLCTQGGLYITNFLLTWPVSKTRVPVAAMLPIIVTFVYGQPMFCEDVFFAAEEYPSVFMRVCWAVTPMFMLCLFVSDTQSWTASEALAGWLLVGISLLPVVIVSLMYMFFKFRVRNIVGDEK